MLFIFAIGLISAELPTCSDSNEIDISDIPCVGLTVSIDCSQNITALNTTDSSINFSIPIFPFIGNISNFTINLTEGAYELVDCSNNTATIIIGKFEQGYGINMFLIILPAIMLSLISLFVSGRMFGKFREDDEEEQEQRAQEDNESDSFVPRSRLMPLIFMIFSFVPMIFMIGFIENHLTEYLPDAGITEFYGMFYILISVVFYLTFLLSFIVWVSFWIEHRKVLRGIE